MAKPFSITGSVLNTNSIKQAIDGYKITYIPIDDIQNNDFNFYNVDDISLLKESIIQSGLQQPLVVVPDNNKYTLISGHRRFKAINEIHTDESSKFETVPCHIIKSGSEAENKLALISANSTTRELTDYEKMEQVRLTKEILNELKDNGFELSGRQRDIIANELGMSATQVQRLDYINKNLTPEYKEELQKENISISVADELSHLSEKEQDEIYNNNGTDVNINTIKSFRENGDMSESDTSEEYIIKITNKKLKKAIKSANELKELSFFDDVDKDIFSDIINHLESIYDKYSSILTD